MYRVACPACGAEVRFHATSSVLAVCPYCQSTLLRDADSVRDIGKMAALLGDYSPLQIAASGIWRGRQFTVVGRIQLQYDAGVWNEWHILFDDGQSAWLADSLGQYVLTHAQGPCDSAPAFDSLQAGQAWPQGKDSFIFSDIRRARCVAGEGELPRQLQPGYDAPVADARCGGRFLTLDYSDGTPPQLYLGEAVTLKQLNMQRLRDERAITAATGKLPGSVQQLACPQCGASLDYRAGTATHLNCPSCGSEVDIQGERATVLGQHQAQQASTLRFTLANGSQATIDGKVWTIIGLLGWVEDKDRNSSWNEYLLYEPQLGFRWLTETRDGWWLGTLMDIWVDQATNDYAIWGKRAFSPIYHYPYPSKEYSPPPAYRAHITYAAGAFPWRARIGDSVALCEYSSMDGNTLLASEQNRYELTWSQSRRVSGEEMKRWFGIIVPDPPAETMPFDKERGRIASWATLLLWGVNLPALVVGETGAVVLILMLATFVMWHPAQKK
ncbi:MAG: DUF4178 domain-containing protein [Vogesella sp.]|uniref:DUF4178 domain-containing protein n=1 Tax=Vogesella sp. TaxID=1904252 RepID=UPI003F2BC589